MTGRTIAQQVAALERLKTPALVERYAALFGKPPHIKNRTWLWRNVAWKLQEQHYGGLSDPARARLAELMAEVDVPPLPDPNVARGTVRRSRTTPLVAPGTVLTRTWRGREYRVEVREDDYALDGVTYGSLTAVAKAITGTHWNGRLFFGLSKRGKA
jgi:hypothetical protein